MKKLHLIPVLLVVLFCSCGTMQSIIRSSFPYTATLVVPATAPQGKVQSASSIGNSFDQNFTDGHNGDRISEVHIVGAKMQAAGPSNFNIGNLSSVKVYMSKTNGDGEIMVASRTDISPGVGNDIVLDIDNSHFLDELVRLPEVRIRMVYQLRNKIDIDASLKIVLNITADPASKK